MKQVLFKHIKALSVCALTASTPLAYSAQAVAINEDAVLESTDIAQATHTPTSDAKQLSHASYIALDIDNLKLDTQGLEQLSGDLLAEVKQLNQAIAALNNNQAELSDEQKAILLQSSNALKSASQGIHTLSQELPKDLKALHDKLPELMQKTGQQLSNITTVLDKANTNISQIYQDYPNLLAATEQQLKASVDNFFFKAAIYSALLIALIMLGLAGIIWLIYKHILTPIGQQVELMSEMPKQIESTALLLEKLHQEHTATKKALEPQGSQTESPAG